MADYTNRGGQWFIAWGLLSVYAYGLMESNDQELTTSQPNVEWFTTVEAFEARLLYLSPDTYAQYEADKDPAL